MDTLTTFRSASTDSTRRNPTAKTLLFDRMYVHDDQDFARLLSSNRRSGHKNRAQKKSPDQFLDRGFYIKTAIPTFALAVLSSAQNA